jgi:hypothetical protein
MVSCRKPQLVRTTYRFKRRAHGKSSGRSDSTICPSSWPSAIASARPAALNSVSGQLGADYFDELLARIRDIRSSERLFYQKITDIYATSIDYDSNAEVTRLFYQTVQNKMHWAAHGHTAAEIVRGRADASQPNMGLTSWKNAPAPAIRKGDAVVAKNYLTSDELEALNLVVSAYLDFAELQALGRRPMHMADWIAKLDDFLRLSDREVLENAGSISHALAEEHAAAEYERFREQQRTLEAAEPSSDFDRMAMRLKEMGEEPGGG